MVYKRQRHWKMCPDVVGVVVSCTKARAVHLRPCAPPVRIPGFESSRNACFGAPETFRFALITAVINRPDSERDNGPRDRPTFLILLSPVYRNCSNVRWYMRLFLAGRFGICQLSRNTFTFIIPYIMHAVSVAHPFNQQHFHAFFPFSYVPYSSRDMNRGRVPIYPSKIDFPFLQRRWFRVPTPSRSVVYIPDGRQFLRTSVLFLDKFRRDYSPKRSDKIFHDVYNSFNRPFKGDELSAKITFSETVISTRFHFESNVSQRTLFSAGCWPMESRWTGLFYAFFNLRFFLP